jgi:methylene-fatty-acyl-phospholipid synthase
MDVVFVLLCCALLALERLTYAWAWNRPAAFARHASETSWLPDDPVLALRRLFRMFKVVQVGVLVAWCQWFAGDWLPSPSAPLPWLLFGLALVGLGQVLNVGVMVRLGTEGVFYGNRFGRNVPWVTGFPFSIAPHPQYLGALMSVWGAMLAMRFPNPDWVVLPLVSMVYYALGARLER